MVIRDNAQMILRNLNFQQVLTFFAVAESGSFTKAAEQMNMTQAAVSRIIARLEKETGLILFVRKARGNFLAPAGRLLYKEWKEAFREFEQGYQKAHEAQTGYILNLSIGSVDIGQNIEHHVGLINWFEKNYPEYRITVEYDRAEVLTEKLISRKLNLMILNSFEARYLNSLGIRCKVLFENPCCVYIHKDHPLYHKEEILPEDLYGQSYTFFGTEHLFASPKLQEFCRSYGLTFRNLYMESDFKNAMISYVRKTGLFFSEDFSNEGKIEESRCILLEDVKSGAVVAWADDNLRPVVKLIEAFAEDFYGRKEE